MTPGKTNAPSLTDRANDRAGGVITSRANDSTNNSSADLREGTAMAIVPANPADVIPTPTSFYSDGEWKQQGLRVVGPMFFVDLEKDGLPSSIRTKDAHVDRLAIETSPDHLTLLTFSEQEDDDAPLTLTEAESFARAILAAVAAVRAHAAEVSR
ncbi:hypothetical protein [Litorihabitans aurantiacus]|uniref:Uncharacterized protein n=1 Tax=Litorihabitans aurantiacus TaxID=1930061 RepID=A0AA37XIQ0_9MICO|nr:hypothetical protein [Litorihabitans aurantiacus]GMA33531.1 hypothetical protein GCM10025875_35230 [Litorihabitans aurantiacus]GMA33617.1 hypothetical protein GCM10025875_36090 [Litorihabitans aurantiacus]